MASAARLESLDLLSHYEKALSCLDVGNTAGYAELAHQLRSNDFNDPEVEQVRRLLSFRLNAITGALSADLSLLEFEARGWIAGERSFLKGMCLMNAREHSVAASCFAEARVLFDKDGRPGRCLLARFNEYVCQVNMNVFDDMEAEIRLLREMEMDCYRWSELPGVDFVRLLILRDRSYIYYEQGKKAASFEEIKRAIDGFHRGGLETDFMICLLHASLVAHELGESLLAKSFLERVADQVEPRVEFAKALVQHLVTGESLPSPQSFKIVPGRWLDIYKQNLQESPAAGWTYFDGLLRRGSSESHSIKEGSLEAGLVQLLLKGKAAKGALIEALWPEQAEAHLLESRFFRLVSRLNAKTSGVVVFDGKRYGLR